MEANKHLRRAGTTNFRESNKMIMNQDTILREDDNLSITSFSMSTAGNQRRQKKNILVHNFPENRFPQISFEDNERLNKFYRMSAVPIWDRILDFVENFV